VPALATPGHPSAVRHTHPTPGDYFGELALLPGGTTRAATVRARSDVSLLVLDRPNFEALLGPLLPQLAEAAKHYTGYVGKAGVQVCWVGGGSGWEGMKGALWRVLSHANLTT
jgi:hypothetical protein